MSNRFSNLTKISPEPAAKLLAQNNIKISIPLEAPASAPVHAVLEELERKKSFIDLLRLLSLALPPRERVWWACLAARDVVGDGVENETRALKAAEDWVFRPTESNREAAINALDQIDKDDKTMFCAMAVQFCDGTMGTGDMAEMAGPPAASANSAFAMNIEAVVLNKYVFDDHMQVVIDRAIDIARGGNGKRKLVTQDATP